MDTPLVAPKLESGKSGRYEYIHALRGIIILQIVALHSFSAVVSQYTLDERPLIIKASNIVVQLLFHGGTLYFATISGMLFASVLYKWPLRKYFLSRVKYVVFPFIVVSFFASTYVVWHDQFRWQLSGFTETILAGVNHVIHGDARYHLWYVPVLVCMLAITPLLMLIKEKSKYVTIAIILLPVLVSRTPGVEFSLQNIAYFSGAYMLGLVIGGRQIQVIEIINRNLKLLCTVALLSSIIIVVVTYYDTHWLYNRIFYIQKIALMFVLIWASEVYYRRRTVSLSLDKIAQSAYAVYLLHVLFIELIVLLFLLALPPPMQPLYVLAIAAGTFVASTAMTIAIVVVLQRLLGSRSKMLIGV